MVPCYKPFLQYKGGEGIFFIIMFSRITRLGVKFNVVIVMLERAGKRLTNVNNENEVLQGPKMETPMFS